LHGLMFKTRMVVRNLQIVLRKLRGHRAPSNKRLQRTGISISLIDNLRLALVVWPLKRSVRWLRVRPKILEAQLGMR
jgi:hypothetical protein